jgi:aspartate carbamoyltransferase catalytic subunit
MATSELSLKKRGRVFYLHFFESATRKRVSLHTNSRQAAKERQRQFDSARARGEKRTSIQDAANRHSELPRTEYADSGSRKADP